MDISALEFSTFSYATLSKDQLYKIFQLRQAVFVVEQNCVYHDIDGKDLDSHHAFVMNAEDEVLAYARLLPKGLTYSDYVSIGRVITSEKARGTGLGKELMIYCLQELQRLWPDAKVKIQAQSYLIKFYAGFGFEIVGEEYLEDDIPHTDMVLLS